MPLRAQMRLCCIERGKKSVTVFTCFVQLTVSMWRLIKRGQGNSIYLEVIEDQMNKKSSIYCSNDPNT